MDVSSWNIRRYANWRKNKLIVTILILVLIFGIFILLQAEESYIDFSDVIVGSSASRHITLFNNSICSLHYRLSIDQTLDGPYPDEMTRSDMIGKYIEPEQDRRVIWDLYIVQ